MLGKREKPRHGAKLVVCDKGPTRSIHPQMAMAIGAVVGKNW
jgi:hypothetical protein